MLPSFILALREGLEAALLIGILLGLLRKTQHTHATRFIWLGTGFAGLVSVLTALVLTRLGLEMKDPGEAIFEGLTMLLAAGILTWMIFWMARQSGSIQASLQSRVERASATGGWSLFGVAFVTVLREGVELALFLTAAAFASTGRQTLLGGLSGLAGAVLLGLLIFASSLRLNLQRFFQVTGLVLVLFAAGLVIRAVGEFIIAGWIPAIIPHVWDLGSFLSEESTLGQTLGALFGYSASPSLMQVVAYLLYFGVVLSGLRLGEAWASKRKISSES